MRLRTVADGVLWAGAVDWDRRLFDSLIPLPDGTSYNAYLVRGDRKVALLDSVDPTMSDVLLSQLESIPRIDYLIHHHAEQDHSGTLPLVMARYPEARVVATPKGKDLLMSHLGVPQDRFITVGDGERLDLGGKTLTFVHTPWVHWPETMCTWLAEAGILFSCDFFGSHLAVSDLFVADEGRVHEAAKRYYAEIMMPFRNVIRNNLQKLSGYPVRLIAPSHGPIHHRPAFILGAYDDWTSETPKNEVVLPYVSMHGSTQRMVSHLVSELAERGVAVLQFNLADADIGKIAIALVDAATIVIGTPTVHVGPHPRVVSIAYLANALRPKARYASLIGSYGWATKVSEQIAAMIPALKVEFLPMVFCKGYPRAADFEQLGNLAQSIHSKHREIGVA